MVEMNSNVITPDRNPNANGDQRDDDGVNTAKHFRRQSAVGSFADQNAHGGATYDYARYDQRDLANDQFADEACGRIHQGDE